jgi:DNA-binding response OmpR family regulator
VTESNPNGSHLLLIEDDEPLGGLLSAHLRARGYAVTVAPTAEAAQDVLAGGDQPDLLLLDINLPGETGWSLLRSEAFAAAGRPPVIVASAMSVSPERLREFGVAGYLPKPFALDTLRSTIERLLAKANPPAGVKPESCSSRRC